MLILGLSGFFHDSAAALLLDGQLMAAAQEERFSRRRHDPAFPCQAADWCLKHAGVDPAAIDFVVWYEKPLRHFERLLETATAFAPYGLRSFAAAMPPWLEEKLWMPSVIRRELPGATNATLLFLEHHQSHAASAFFPSPFQQAAVLTVDGVGEWAAASWGRGEGNRIELVEELHFPHSLGLLYSAFTGHLGFRVNSGEYKVMGLAPYGKPVWADLIRERLLELRSDGSFRLRQEYFSYCHGLRMTSRRFARLFGVPPRVPESPLLQCHMDLAASIQVVAEDLLLGMVRRVHQQTQLDSLVLAGGVALNCVANARLLREGPFRKVWVQPAAGDAGGAVGAALFVWHQLLNQPRLPAVPDGCRASLTGPVFGESEVTATLQKYGVGYERITEDTELMRRVAMLLNQGKTIGWFQGAMEFGPRALGNRSILADARSTSMQSILNLQVKFRESFRPFAPVVLREQADQWFDVEPHADLPYMLFTAAVHPTRLIPLTPAEEDRLQHSPDLLERLRIPRSLIPAVTHVDNSARLQTVDRDRHPRLHALLTAFERLTGCPVLVNTSFNVRGEPIVCTPEDALACFKATGLDVLVLENFLIEDKTFSVFPARQRHAQAVTQPSPRTLRQFALLCMLFSLAAAASCYRSGLPGWCVAGAGLAALVSLPGLFHPAIAAPVFFGLMWVTTPVRWLTSRLLLFLIYFAVVFPIGLLQRFLRHDPLQLLNNDRQTFWKSRSGQSSSALRPW
jgi:carbamoyltransferase